MGEGDNEDDIELAPLTKPEESIMRRYRDDEEMMTSLSADGRTVLTDHHTMAPPKIIATSNKRNMKRWCCGMLVILTCAIAGLAVGFRQNAVDIFNRASKRPPSHEAFDMVSSETLKEYNSRMTLYRHKKTAAEFLAYTPKSSDEDKAFGVGFRTVPTSSTGVAHVLEHSVLNGSRKYPSKDPFLHLLKGSLQTFLNAMTYNDRTVYPVASRNAADFQNLVRVYLDAVFHPRAVTPEGDWVIKQEGWRYDVSSDNTLDYTGVVFSEMKGVYSDPESVLFRTTEANLFPNNTYHYDSGGDPSVIPTLTWKDFVAFYHQHYHPTNSKIFVSGDSDDVKALLAILDEYLSEFDADPQKREQSRIPYQPKYFKQQLILRQPYAVSEVDGSGQHMAAVTWLLHDQPLDRVTEMALSVLNDLLLGTTSSKLYKDLLDSKLGTNVIGGGMDTTLLQYTYSVGMKGVQESDVAAVETAILKSLQEAADQGFSADDISSSINSIEFALRELNTGSTPTGIVIFLAVMSRWNYDFEPKTALEFEDTLKELKDIINVSGSKIFQDLITNYILSNNHRVFLELYPSATYGSEQAQKEKDALAAFKASLTDEQFQEIVTESKQLKELQNIDDPPDVVAKIPSLSISDLDKSGTEYPISVEENAFGTGVTLVSHEVASSLGIAYVDYGIDISKILYEDIDLLPLLTKLMTETGTSNLTDTQLDQLIGMNTGGVSVSTLFEPVLPVGVNSTLVTDGSTMRTLLFVRGKCTSPKISDMFNIYSMILADAKLDSQDEAIIILSRDLSDMKAGIPSSGHSYANMRINARYSVQSFFDEKLYGVSRVEALKLILNQAKDSWPDLLKRLENMRETILTSSMNKRIINLTGDKSVLNDIKSSVQTFLESQMQTPNLEIQELENFRSIRHPWIGDANAEMQVSVPIQNEGISVSSEVSYVGKGGPLYKLGEAVPGSADVVSRFLKNGYLWETVRVKNGAYGAMTSLRVSEGLFNMLSYRDPNLLLTLNAYDDAADSIFQQLSSREITDAVLTTAIIGSIGALDGSALPPDSVGWTSLLQWMSGKDAMYRQRWRDEILNTKQNDFNAFADRLKGQEEASIAVIGSEASFDQLENDSDITLTRISIQ